MEGLDEEHWGLFSGGLWRADQEGPSNTLLAPLSGIVRMFRRLLGGER